MVDFGVARADHVEPVRPDSDGRSGRTARGTRRKWPRRRGSSGSGVDRVPTRLGAALTGLSPPSRLLDDEGDEHEDLGRADGPASQRRPARRPPCGQQVLAPSNRRGSLAT
ncbi:hypothetical protein BN6_35030 [Saccharothrix espanaensis DSM 44229]|uniref:Uncharacterized protein n=1 Tax=Saccharothrix espanaensis (strain ATCC 51144 / DSM 44229 / JCM 9112 / NBRC 15066 / NRRL 15764) TaxID=1179773 RepID=K0JXG6_SACES|nr:hypothetical protein BN6_35030 [Saccharothrix espanaensis DSM 44229]